MGENISVDGWLLLPGVWGLGCNAIYFDAIIFAYPTPQKLLEIYQSSVLAVRLLPYTIQCSCPV